jgi:hypothetical protein
MLTVSIKVPWLRSHDRIGGGEARGRCQSNRSLIPTQSNRGELEHCTALHCTALLPWFGFTPRSFLTSFVGIACGRYGTGADLTARRAFVRGKVCIGSVMPTHAFPAWGREGVDES